MPIELLPETPSQTAGPYVHIGLALAAAGNRPLWTRQQIDTDPAVQAQLPVLPWLADTIVQLIITLKGGSNGAYNRSNRDYSPRRQRPADDERTGAIGDD